MHSETLTLENTASILVIQCALLSFVIRLPCDFAMSSSVAKCV